MSYDLLWWSYVRPAIQGITVSNPNPDTQTSHQGGGAESQPRWGCIHGGRVASHRCRANSAHIRQSRPDAGLEFQVKVL